MTESDGRHHADLQQIFARYVERLNAGEAISPWEIEKEHPELADEIFDQLELFRATFSPTGCPVGDGEPACGTIGDYTLRRPIGRGGMGVVYEAWEGSMDRRVALKVLPAGVAADEKAVQRFVREARTAGSLSHPNVVSVYGMGVKEQTPYYAMEYVEGKTLAELVRGGAEAERDAEKNASRRGAEARRRDAKDEEARSFRAPSEIGDFARIAKAFAEAADGLQHAHSKGVVHRDIKPSNLILDTDGRLRVLDFGLARLEGQESLTLSGDFVGTPAYMSPEQAKRRKIPVDHRTDIYSLGATLYQVLTRQQPFRGKSHEDTLSQIIERDVRPPRQRNARIPQDLETIVLKCLRKEAGDRYGTAEALGQDLRRFVRGDPIEARPEAGWERFARGVKYRRASIAGTTMVTLLLLAFVLLFIRYRLSASREALFLYEAQVRGGLMKLLLAETTLKAARDKTLGLKTNEWLDTEDVRALIPRHAGNPLSEALEGLERATQLLPERPEAYYHAGRTLLLLNRRQEAHEALTQALQADPGFIPATVLLAESTSTSVPETSAHDRNASWTRLWLSAHEARAQKNWELTAEAYGGLIELEQSGEELFLGADIESRMGRALSRIELEDYPGAIEDLAAARDSWPTFLEPAFLLAKSWYLLGYPEQAERIFLGLVEEETQSTDEISLWAALTYLSLGAHETGLEWAKRIHDPSLRERFKAGFFYQLRSIDEAIAAGRKSIALNADDFYAHIQLGLSLYYNDAGADPELHREIVSLAEQAVKLNSTSCRGYELLGMGLRLQGKHDEALAAMRKAVAADPDDASARNNRGWTLFKMGNLDEAEKEIRAALRMLDHPIGRWSLGSVLKARGLHDSALTEFSAAIDGDPKLHQPYVEIADIYEERGDPEKEAEWCQKVLKVSPDDSGIHYRLGSLLFREGELESAESHLRRAIELSPRRVKAHLELAEVLLRQGKHGDALSCVDQALSQRPGSRRAHELKAEIETELDAQ